PGILRRCMPDFLAYFRKGCHGWKPLRRCMPDFLAYFRKGFHPWQQDNRALLEKNLRELDPETAVV
ncbi:MAG: hypothetical protein ACTH3S_17215, partial [Marinobacter sp.]